MKSLFGTEYRGFDWVWIGVSEIKVCRAILWRVVQENGWFWVRKYKTNVDKTEVWKGTVLLCVVDPVIIGM